MSLSYKRLVIELVEGVIWFNYPKAFNQLMTHGEVFTLRKSIKNGTYVLLSKLVLNPPKTGRLVKVEYIGRVFNKDMLEDYVSKSGYESVDKWMERAGDSVHLHRVVLLRP